MRSLFAALLAAGTVFVLNRYLLQRARPAFTVAVSPFIEEGAKTLFAILLTGSARSIVAVHAMFGAVEGFSDLITGSKTGIGAGIISLAGHLIFGAITLEVIASGGILWGISAGSTAHLAWNLLVLKFLVRN